MTATTFISKQKAVQIADYLESKGYSLELKTGTIDCPILDASDLYTAFKYLPQNGDYFCNIVEPFCLLNNLDVKKLAASVPL